MPSDKEEQGSGSGKLNRNDPDFRKRCQEVGLDPDDEKVTLADLLLAEAQKKDSRELVGV